VALPSTTPAAGGRATTGGVELAAQ
jgi:hypothetical protein